MKYILGICNAVAAALLAYIILLNTNHLNVLEREYETILNKYKTENAAEVSYVSEVYHLGDWSTVLADSLSLQNHTGLSDEARTRAVMQVGTALHFEETLCSYLVAFEDSLTTIVRPYVLIENSEYTLLTNITFTGGTLINYNSQATLSLNNANELISAYREVRGIDSNISDENIYNAMRLDRTIFINDIISEAMGHTAHGEQDRIFIPVNLDNRMGLNSIENQTIMVLSSSDSVESSTTTLAAYTKTDKRFWCEISGPRGKYYCYADELPDGYAIDVIYDSAYDASQSADVLGRYYFGK